jgi:glucose uptake protein GlcU
VLTYSEAKALIFLIAQPQCLLFASAGFVCGDHNYHCFKHSSSSDQYAYISSISGLKWSMIICRLIFSVGVSSPVAMLKSLCNKRNSFTFSNLPGFAAIAQAFAHKTP